MNGVFNSVTPKLSSQRIWFEMFSNFWIIWSSEVSESLNSIFLSDFKYYWWPIWKVLNKRKIFWKYTLINFHEFFDNFSWKMEHLSSWYLETGLHYHINHLTKLSRFNNMWLNNTKGAIIKDSSCFHQSILRFSSEKEIYFSLSWLGRVCSVCCVFSTICSKQSSERTWCFLLRFLCISWSN